MQTPKIAHRWLAAGAGLIATIASVNCTARATGHADASHTVAVNGRIVPVTSQHSLLEVARTRISDFRLGSPGRRHPCRFYVDHVEITNGLAWMGGTRAMDVDSLRMLSPTEAVTRFGGTARGGALLVFTRRN